MNLLNPIQTPIFISGGLWGPEKAWVKFEEIHKKRILQDSR